MHAKIATKKIYPFNETSVSRVIIYSGFEYSGRLTSTETPV